MANDNSLPPNDPKSPDNPLSNEDNWFLDEVSASPTEPLEDDDDALGLSDFPPPDGPSTSFVGKIKLPPRDPDDALADLPPVMPSASGSGWLGVPTPTSAPAPKPPVPETSDIFSPSLQGESDVIRNLSEPMPSSSNIFDSPLAGSSRFENPDDGTEDVVEGAAKASELPVDPSSDFFMDDPDLAPMSGSQATDMIESLPLPMPLSSDSGPDFNRTNVGDSGSNLFADSIMTDELSFGESGVNLHDPDRSPDSNRNAGAGSSIFGADLKDLDDDSLIDVGEIPLMGSSDDPTDALLFHDDDPGDGTSNIFERGQKHPMGRNTPASSDIALDMHIGDDGTEEMDADGGKVDWSLPEVEDDQLSQMRVMPSDLSGAPGLSELLDDGAGIPISKPAPKRVKAPIADDDAEPPRPSRTRKAEPAAESGRKSGIGGMIAGEVAGLVLGAGGFAGAYFGGLLPNETASPQQPLVSTAPPVDLQPFKDKVTAAEKEASEAKDAAKKAEEAKFGLATALAAQKEAAVSATTAAEKADADKLQAMKELTAAKLAMDDQAKLLTDATTKVTDLTKDVTAAKKLADEQAVLAKDADEKAKTALAKVAAADGALGDVIKELKANKLVDEKDDQAAVLAKLPEVMKAVTTAATSADAKKAAAALQAATKAVDVAKADAKKSQDESAIAKATADKATLDAKTAMATLTAAKDDSQKKLDDARRTALLADARAKSTQDQLSEKLQLADRNAASQALLIEQLRKQVTDARSGNIVPLSTPEIVAADRADATFGTGLELYFAGRYADAERVFRSATAVAPNDARYWYFLGLSQYLQGNATAAEPSFKKGAELESRYQPSVRAITAALERVQGPARQALAKYRP